MGKAGYIKFIERLSQGDILSREEFAELIENRDDDLMSSLCMMSI